MRATHFFAGALAVFGMTPASLAQLSITSAERAVRSDVEWTALFEADSETESYGPIYTFGQWDATADANPTDPVDWGNRVITEQHSLIGSTLITAEMTVEVSSWPNRPSLGYVTLESENVFDFAFTITEPTPVDIVLVCDAYAAGTAVDFEYTMQRIGGGFFYLATNREDYGFGSRTGFAFNGILQPGDYFFASTASFLLDFQPVAITPQSWHATFSMTAVPAAGTASALAIAGLPWVMRRRR